MNKTCARRYLACNRNVSRRRDSRAAGAVAAAVEPLERRVCLSVSFSGPVSWPTDEGPADVAVGDFNGDGHADLVTGNGSGNNTASILLGNGSGGFSAPTSFPIGSNPTSVAVGDVNGDGKQDLVFTEPQFSEVVVLLGDGTGGFLAGDAFVVGSVPVSVAVADLNGDGNQDLAVANFGSNNVSVLLGDGTGSFGAATNFTVGDAPASVTVGDFNADDRADIAVVGGGSAVTAGYVRALIGNGAGNFGIAAPITAGFAPVSVSVAELNGDGIDDLAVANRGSNSVGILLGTGGGGLSAPTDFVVNDQPVSVAVADFDGDGNQDFCAVSVSLGVLSVRLGDGTGGFSFLSAFFTDGSPSSVAVGDFNDDGKPDAVSANPGSDNVNILLNTTIARPSLTNVAVTSSILENGIATLSGNIDHGQAGHSFTLVVDWGDGSTPEEFAYPVGTTTFSETHRYLDDDPTGSPSDTFAIELVLRDDAGTGIIALTSLTVANVAPEVTLSGGGSVVRGVPLGFAGAFADVGTLDTHEVMWDFGDGTNIAFHSTTDPGALTPTHVYSANGNYIVTMTIRDDDTGEDAVTSSVLVSAVGLIADPTSPGKSMLVVGGTAGDDDIRFARVNRTSNIDAFIGTQYLGRFNPTSRLVVFAGAGNDTVAMDKNISLSAILLGGDGDDVLTAGSGRDVLIGGADADRINGVGDDDILIAGTTAHDANLIGLGRILNEWTSSASQTVRVNNLKTGGGLSAGFALNTSTVFDDAASDVLTGGAGKDWFLFGNGDLLTDMSNQESATFI